MITFEKYIKEVLDKFELIRKDSSHQLNWFFENLTPGSIRSASKEVFYTRKGNLDSQILSAFFNISKDKDLYSHLGNTKAEKFLTVKNFLNGLTQKPNKEIVEFTAWLIDFQPRPYSEFRKSEGKSSKKVQENNSKNNVIVCDDNFDTRKVIDENDEGRTKDGIREGKLKKIVITITFIGITILIYFIPNWEQKDCMIWKENHYEKTTCGTTSYPDVLYDQNLVENFKKVKLDTTMVFFKNGKALFWYDREGGDIEFFTTGGRHPVNNKILRPVTETIVRKYVFGE
ncbi:hypothetical protein J8281_06780 [Aquimarina sp. U1-2]|uniref:hypothetical protein n=1 Tax=Aquimarina sp. U1-2 TaxID=2823141 RepID=UPI001AEC98AB|nr:hypothetical protein [Aquimarina sp. U1-2]MBP2831889.1 hypothetical protein [Aquimarina sp. U1-2]